MVGVLAQSTCLKIKREGDSVTVCHVPQGCETEVLAICIKTKLVAIRAQTTKTLFVVCNHLDVDVFKRFLAHWTQGLGRWNYWQQRHRKSR